MANPNEFGGNVSVIRKGHTEPFVIQPNHGFAENSRGVGAAEMAWSIRNDRKNRANKEMAFNALEALHGIVISCETKMTYQCRSTFDAVSPLPQGYLGGKYMDDPETAIAL